MLEDRKVRRVGGTQERAIDVRFVAATNRDLAAAAERSEFRQDLYFRLNGISLTIPPLRERPEDIEPLIRMFLAASGRDLERADPLTISPRALAVLQSYSWPGNIRQLRNAVERGALLCTAGTIDVDLPLEIARANPIALAVPKAVAMPAAVPSPMPSDSETAPPVAAGDEVARLKEEVRRAERTRIEEALKACAGNQTRAAELLGISRRTLVARLADLDISRPRSR